MSVSAFIAKILDDALKRPAREPAPPFRLITVGGVRARPGVALDRPRALDALDDETLYGSENG